MLKTMASGQVFPVRHWTTSRHTATGMMGMTRVTIPKWPYFRLVKQYHWSRCRKHLVDIPMICSEIPISKKSWSTGQPVEKPRWTHLKSMNPWRSWAILAIHGTLSERRREKFPIFFRRGKLPLGPYKVQGPQAQARKKSECPGEKPDTRESSWEIFGVTIFMFKKHNKI